MSGARHKRGTCSSVADGRLPFSRRYRDHAEYMGSKSRRGPTLASGYSFASQDATGGVGDGRSSGPAAGWLLAGGLQIEIQARLLNQIFQPLFDLNRPCITADPK